MPSQFEPEFAAVRPRVVVDADGPARLLEEEVGALLAAGEPRCIALIGPPSQGRRTAMCHLAAVFADEPELLLLDPQGSPPALHHVVVQMLDLTADVPASWARWTLAPWTDDDCFDYLLAEHPAVATPAYALWRHPAPLPDLRRWPRLCRLVLDHLAHLAATTAQESASDPLCALAFVIANELGQRRAVARQVSLHSFAPPHARDAEPDPAARLVAHERELLRSVTVRALLAAEDLLRAGAEGSEPAFPPRAWPEPLCAAIAHLLHADPVLMHRMLAHAARPPRRPALLLSLLSVAVPDFRPPIAKLRHFAGARAIGIDLRDVAMVRADLEGALLRDARLDGADLRHARAMRLLADGLQATGLRADHADFTDASLRTANLSEARLSQVSLLRADLTAATLRGADLRRANLIGCRANEANFADARLDGADLSDADLTGAILAGASLRACNLRGARLDSVDLQDADLRGAVLDEEHRRLARRAQARVDGDGG